MLTYWYRSSYSLNIYNGDLCDNSCVVVLGSVVYIEFYWELASWAGSMSNLLYLA